MKRNIIRPGYTFGNPAFSDGCVEPDRRFANIALAAKENKDISIIRNDGTQFISAENQAEVFARVLESDCDEEIFLALGSRWISWKQIAECAISLVPGCTSKIIEKDLGWGETPMLYSVRKIEDNFGLRFDALPDIEPHLKYYMDK